MSRSIETIPENVRALMARLEAAGHEAWCVGGAVRDSLLGRPPGDWDVTTDALPEEVMALFPGALPTGLKHGTVTIGGGRGVEVTTYRVDGTYLDGRHPDQVTFTRSLREDLARRDFTVNAMAVDLRGEIADPFGGWEDLENGILRAVGRPEDRFQEDGLRILRGLRFAARLGFQIEPATDAAIRRCAPLLERIASERIREEITGLLLGAHAAEVLLAYPDVLGVPMPEILPAVGFDQRNRYHCYDVWEHTVRSIAAVGAQPVLRWAMLFHDLGKPDTFTVDETGQGHFYGHWKKSGEKAAAIMSRLRFDNRSRRTIQALVERHDAPLLLTERCVRRDLAKYGEETVRLLLEVKRADNLAQAEPFRDQQVLMDQWETLLNMVLAEGDCFTLKQLAVKGRDLMELGLQGPEIGKCLEALLEQVVDGKLPNDREILLEYVEGKLR